MLAKKKTQDLLVKILCSKLRKFYKIKGGLPLHRPVQQPP